MSPLKGTPVCARCHRTDLRLIGGNVCVGCKNCEYERLKGRNSRGKPPAHHPALERPSVSYLWGGQVRTLSRGNTASAQELVVGLLRDQGKRLILGRTCVGARMRQRVLL